MQAIGGAVAIVVGAYIFNSQGSNGFISTIFDTTIVQHSHVVVTESVFAYCSATSFTGGSSSASLGVSSVFGGALALLHAAQVSEFIGGSLLLPKAPILAGTNLTVLISNSNFFECSALTRSTSVRPGSANGGGGAVYASSVALLNFSVSNCSFSSSSVAVACGATGAPSNSSGGALAFDASGSSYSVVAIASCIFFNCTARGANIANMAVRGGAVAVYRATSVSVVSSTFTNCSISAASPSSSVETAVVSGGAGMSVVLAQNVSIERCLFDATGGQDVSGTSTGLLVLASNSQRSMVSTQSTSFKSSSVALNVQCVSGNGSTNVLCPQTGPLLSVAQLNLSQLASQYQLNFNATGSSIMLLQQNVGLESSNSFIECYDLQFAVFKKQSQASLQYVDYSCSPCPFFQIARTSSVARLATVSTALSIDTCLNFSSELNSALSCPFGVDFCTTILNVTSGFWTNYTQAGQLNNALRCPAGYCGCGSELACPLYPPLSIDYRPDDALCNGNRTGVLCGGCKQNFTQSLDGVTCLSNDECANNVVWTWVATFIGYAVYAVYTVHASTKENDGLITCVIFYGQMSLFASYQHLTSRSSVDSTSSSAASSWFARISQFESITSISSKSCYGLDMGAYAVTAAQLSGPAIVLVLSVAIALVLKRVQRRKNDVKVSVSATLSTVILLLFSSVTTIVFKLVTCRSVSDDLNVIFLDGTQSCQDAKWKGLFAVVVILCLFPVLFVAALRWKRLPPNIRTTVCSAYKELKYYWGAVTLTFRLVMSIVYAGIQASPSIAALVQLALCFAMLLLLTYQQPYRIDSTHHFDVLCYVCLIIQFVLEVLVRATESLGISVEPSNPFLHSLDIAYQTSFGMRCTSTASPLFL
jgi:hypothetical protein